MDGQRIDKVLIEALGMRIGRSGAKALFEAGAVRIEGKRVPKGRVARKGERVLVRIPELSVAAVPEPSALLDVRLERADLVVVCKPAGMPSAPLAAGETGTLARALLGHYPEMVCFGHSPREPGLVHGLVSGTSGLLVAARTASAFEQLTAALRDGQLHKAYLLLCAAEGLAPSGVIEVPLCAHPKDSKRVMACMHPRDADRYHARPASTSYRVRDRAGPIALVEATVARAARHQLRAHFAAIGHPLIGDVLYGGSTELLTRQALHASGIRCDGNPTLPGFSVQAELPEDLARIWAGAQAV